MIALARASRRALAVTAALISVACSGGGASQSSPPGTVCPTIVSLASGALIQPANGATGVSTTVGSVTATSSTDLRNAQLILTPAGGAAFDGGVFGDVSGTTALATVPVLSAQTNYVVTASSGGPCPGSVLWSFGSFTTG